MQSVAAAGFYLFDRHCQCIFSARFPTTINTTMNTTTSSNEKKKEQQQQQQDGEEHSKLIFGVLHSLRQMISKLTPPTPPTTATTTNGSGGGVEGLRWFSTGEYTCFYARSATGLVWALFLSNSHPLPTRSHPQHHPPQQQQQQQGIQVQGSGVRPTEEWMREWYAKTCAFYSDVLVKYVILNPCLKWTCRVNPSSSPSTTSGSGGELGFLVGLVQEYFQFVPISSGGFSKVVV